MFFFEAKCAAIVDNIKFKVFSTGSGFTGYYIVDSNDSKNLEDNGNASGNYSYEKDAGELKYIEINVENKIGATSMVIKIYRNDVKVKEKTLDTVTGAQKLNLTYRYKEEESATTPPAK